MEINEKELHQTMEEFLDEDQHKRNIWNGATISGLVILFLTISYLMQLIIGSRWGPDLAGIIQILPIVGGMILIIVGFGFLAGNKQKNRSDMLQNDIERNPKGSAHNQREEKSTSSKGESSSKDHAEDTQNSGSSGSSYSTTTETGSGIDSYGLQQNKKLYKSRTDKKLCGVCGGLASYFGISSLVVRLLFVVLTLIGWGSAAIVYVALWIALKKEPIEKMQDVEASRS